MDDNESRFYVSKNVLYERAYTMRVIMPRKVEGVEMKSGENFYLIVREKRGGLTFYRGSSKRWFKVILRAKKAL